MSKLTVSVIVASHNARETLAECLNALENQQGAPAFEVIVVDNSTDGSDEIVRRQFPQVQLVLAAPQSYIPELWEIGINQSAGDIVALTTGHFIPRQDWVEAIRQAHTNPHAGIGGAIENDPHAGWVDWAIYFCRYTPYMLPFLLATRHDIAGDNASYKRAALEQCQEVRRNGFWEPVVHADMHKCGLALLVSPEIVVTHRKSFALRAFLRQRFHHGRQFGSGRAATMPGAKRLLYIMASPLIPGVFLARIIPRVFLKRRHRLRLLLALPLMTLFLTSWATGELCGYLGLSTASVQKRNPALKGSA